MQAYANKSRQSNVRYFSIKTFPALGAASLTVRFADKWVYIYHTRLLPLSTVQHMIALAQAGQGLNSYITRNNPSYTSKQFNAWTD